VVKRDERDFVARQPASLRGSIRAKAAFSVFVAPQEDVRLPGPVAGSSGAHRVRQAVAYMQRAHSDLRLSTRRVASEVGVTREHLCRLFQRHIGRTPLHCLHTIRINRAQELLALDGMSVFAIARECGYDTTGELDFHFRRRAKCSPTAFRARVRDLQNQQSGTGITIKEPQSLDAMGDTD
jgi:transcriptional regulator GlxA family with amidase domain